MRDLQKDLETCNKATPGPWDWDVNKHCHSVRLENHKWVVMDFVRWGMGSAQPRFNFEGILEKASDLAIERQAHHVGFDMTIMHDDALFIAQAREGWPHAIERALEAEETVKNLEGIVRSLLDVLEDVARQTCYLEETKEYDSMAIGAYADMLAVLCSFGRFELDRSYGRRVIAKAKVVEQVGKYYPAFKWCERYSCWCDDVPDITDNENDFNGNCTECEDCAEVG